LNGLVVADVPDIAAGTATLSLLINERGGIIDDTIITNFGDHIFMVINAGCKDKDLAHLLA
jgi:aminomethyltransferase